MIYNLLHSKSFERLKRFIGKKSGIYLKLKKFTASASEPLRTTMLINHFGIDHVIDVGANTGQFAESLFDFGYNNKVISFEPVQSCYDKLLKRSSKYENWIVGEKCAIGDMDGVATINVTDDTVFSSILNVANWHSKLKPKSKIVSHEEINIYKLDTIIPKLIDLKVNNNILLKIDTQGFEKQVLDGARELIKKVIGIKIEIPLIPSYEGVQFTFYEVIEYLKQLGYNPYSFNIEGVNLKTGQVNTIDGLFFRENIENDI